MPRKPTIPSLVNLPSIPIIGGEGGPSFDPDAQAYFTRAGVTDQTAKTNISSFITQLKAASLWTNLTAGWLCRSAYNAGSGTTVYDIKADAKNGTMVNGPSWNADGIGFTGNTQAVTTGHTQTMNGNWTAIAFFKDGLADGAANVRVFGTTNAAAMTLMAVQDFDKSATSFVVFDGAAAVTLGASGANVTAFDWWAVTYNTSTDTLLYNSTGLQGGDNVVFAAASHVVQLSASDGTGMSAARISAAFIYGSNTLDATQVSNFCSIGNSTIVSDL